MNVTNALEIALNHLDCLTAGQHPFIKEGRRALMTHEVSEIEIDLARAVTEKNWMERTLPPQIESERKANEQLTAENEALRAERDELRAEYQQLMAENIVLRTKSNELQTKIEGGVRVYAERNEFAAHMYECWVIATDKYNATLILDDGVEI